LYWQFVFHGQGATKADMEVSIDCGSDWKTFSVLLKLKTEGQTVQTENLTKKLQN